jgi:predicted DNA-binding transcriptional regulator YafY
MDQPKIERVLRLLQLLIGNRRKTSELACILECDIRTLQRYIDTFSRAGYIVEYHSRGIPFLNPNDGSLKKISDLVHFSEEEAYILHKAIDSIDDNTTLKQNLKGKLYNIYNFPWLADVIIKPEQGSNVHALIEAIEEKRCVKLIDYRSANSNTVSDRLVEPYRFTTNYQQVWCYEPSANSCKLFKIARIGVVKLLDENWKNEEKHNETCIDVFRISGTKFIGKAIIRLNVRACSLLVEEYPLAEQYIKKENGFSYLFEAQVCSYEGIGRFILGLYSDVEVMGDKKLVQFIGKKISLMRSKVSEVDVEGK